jgi:hypothetical protein
VSPLEWAIAIGLPIAAIAAGVLLARRTPPRHWDHIEEQWPSPGGWAGRERL